MRLGLFVNQSRVILLDSRLQLYPRSTASQYMHDVFAGYLDERLVGIHIFGTDFYRRLSWCR